MTSEIELSLWCGCATAFVAGAYTWAWRRLRPHGATPTGFGVFFAPALLVISLASGASSTLSTALAVVTAAAFIYWIDDFAALSARFRVILSFAVGAAIGAVFITGMDGSPLAIGLVLLAGAINLALVNTINFQDGADLNLACFILLTGALLYGYSTEGAEWRAIAIACLAFSVPFAILNSRPQTIYFGDSGSFVFACTFTIMGAAYLMSGEKPPPEAAIPAALPTIDMAFVTLLRIRIRQRFTVRHYFHLYQRLQKDQRGFFYLLPQVACVALSVIAATLLQSLGVERTPAVALGTAVVSLPTFLFFRRVFVTGEPGPPRERGAPA